jgi:hypothetical protein
MGHLFDDLSYATPKHLYAGAPVDEIKSLNAQKSKDYQEARGTSDALDIAAKNLNVRDVDYEGKKKYIEGLKQSLADTVDKGDWQNAKYKIGDEVKKFQTDPFLNSAQSAYKAKQQHYQDLKGEYDKGNLSEKAMNYALAKSKNEGITVNPDGTVSGGYSASKILNDKEIEKQISDEAEKFINDYKADTFIVNGDQYKKLGNGQYFSNLKQKSVGFDEVKAGLVQQIKNRHQDFLQQEKAIDLHNLKGGQNRPIELNDFASLGYNPDKLQENILKSHGLSDEDIKKLETIDPVKASIAKNNQETIKTQLSNEEGRNQLFNNLYDDKQLNKYSNPYANKAAYKEEDIKWELDHDRQKNIDFSHAKALADYGQKLKEKDVPPTIFGDAPLEKLTSKHLEGLNETNDEISNNIKQTEANLKNAQTDKQKNELALQLQNLKNQQQTGYGAKVEVLKKLNTANPEVLNKYITYGLYNKNNKDGVLNEIINNPDKYNREIGGFARTLLSKIKNNEALASNRFFKGSSLDKTKEISDQDIQTLNSLIEKSPNKDILYQKAVNTVDNNNENIRKYETDYLGKTAGKTTGLIHGDNIKNYLKDVETKTVEKNNIMTDYANKNFAITKQLEPENNALKDLVVNGMTTLTRNGLNLDQFLLSKDLKTVDGKPITSLDWENLDVRPQLNWTTGEPSIQVSVKNAVDDSSKEGQNNFPTYTFNASDPNVIRTSLKQMGETLYKSSNSEAKQQGAKILSNVEYGQDVTVFNPKVGGLKPQTTVYIKGHPVTLRGKLVKSNGAEDVYQLFTVNENGTVSKDPIGLTQSNGKEYTSFKSAEDVADGLFNTYNK